MPTTQTLYYTSQQLNIYWGLLMFILGIIGSLWNIFIFRHYSFRSSSCSTYMLIGSIASLIQILFSLLDQIIDKGFQIQWTTESIVWCKIRFYIAQCATLAALSCLILSVIDRFFSTCQQIKWRHLSSVYTARQISSFVIVFWMFLSIPVLIYTKPIKVSLHRPLCTSFSVAWSKITTCFFNLCCYGIFPWFFMSIFGCLTSRNIREKRNHRMRTLPSYISSRMARLDDQLTSMLFVQIIISIISSVPFCIQSFYKNLTATIEKNEHRQAQDYLFEQISILNFYGNFVLTFYVDYCSSTIFRKVSKQVLMDLFRKPENRSRQITIVHHRENPNQSPKQQLQVFTVQSPCSISPL